MREKERERGVVRQKERERERERRREGVVRQRPSNNSIRRKKR